MDQEQMELKRDKAIATTLIAGGACSYALWFASVLLLTEDTPAEKNLIYAEGAIATVAMLAGAIGFFRYNQKAQRYADREYERIKDVELQPINYQFNNPGV